jgi:hypothetical protein
MVSGLLGCSASVSEPAPLHDATGAPLIATLRLRDSVLRIAASSSSAGGLRYEVQDASGEWHADLTIEELERMAPELSEVARSASAGAASAGAASAGAASAGAAFAGGALDGSVIGSPIYLDARVERVPSPPSKESLGLPGDPRASASGLELGRR